MRFKFCWGCSSLWSTLVRHVVVAVQIRPGVGRAVQLGSEGTYCFPAQWSNSTAVLHEWLRSLTRCLPSIPPAASGLDLRVAGPHQSKHDQAARTLPVLS